MITYEIQKSKSGAPTLVAHGEKDTRLHSAYDPEKEADRAVYSFSPGRASIILVSGVALGYHLKRLREKFPHHRIIAAEKEKKVITLIRSSCPGNLEGITLVSSPAEVVRLFETFDMASFRGVAHFIHRPSYLLYKDFYESIAAEFRQQVSSRVSDILTRLEFEERWIGNIFANIHHVEHATPVQSLFGKFKKIPGIIVSAGPSLRKNIDLLPQLSDRALILSVDTAFKVLARKKIKPHIVMTLDAQKHSLRHFLGVPGEESLLCADVVSSPAILRAWPGPALLSTTAQYFTNDSGKTHRESTPGMSWFEEVMPPLGDVQSGGSVATSAFDLLLNCGCDPIILLGQDLAYTGREIHCSGTHHNDDWLPLTNRFKNLDTINQQVIRRRSITRLEKFGGGGEVITDFVLNLYRGWFEDSAARVPATVINATEGGLRIGNTREVQLSELAAELPVPGKSPREILSEALGPAPGAALKLYTALKNAQSAIKKTAVYLEKTSIPPDEIDGYLEKNNIAGLVSPFLRQSTFYIIRRGLDDEKAREILNRDIKNAALKLLPMIEVAIKRLAEQQV